jgi:hypothetical protein
MARGNTRAFCGLHEQLLVWRLSHQFLPGVVVLSKITQGNKKTSPSQLHIYLMVLNLKRGFQFLATRNCTDSLKVITT